MYDEFESLADDLERVERLFKYIEYFMLPQFNAPRDRTEKGCNFSLHHCNLRMETASSFFSSKGAQFGP